MPRRIIIVALLVLLLSLFNICSGSKIQVLPSYQFKQQGTAFDVIIYCSPSEAIKGYEFKVEFNKSILHATAVTKGNFFNGYPEFFSLGTIQNEQGQIINIYSLIIGQGNVSSYGSLVVISFITMGQDGVSPIRLYDCGITNETKYLALDVQNGNIQAFGEYYPWDINEDNKVNYLELSSIVSHYGQPSLNKPWDIVENGIVDFMDVSALVSHYGESY